MILDSLDRTWGSTCQTFLDSQCDTRQEDFCLCPIIISGVTVVDLTNAEPSHISAGLSVQFGSIPYRMSNALVQSSVCAGLCVIVPNFLSIHSLCEL